MSPMASDRFAAAYVLDCLLGDPQGMPHPVRWIGSAISAGESVLLRPGTPATQLLSGAALTITIVLGSGLVAAWISRLGGAAGEILLGWTTLATRSLLAESAAVLDSLEDGDLEQARQRLAMIVGRDTEGLDEPEILRAVIETVAEGLCDGVVAPILYLAVGGPPLAIAFKAVNTLDSMIGHRESPYLYFGRVAARLDDAANYIPARITVLAIVAAAFLAQKHARRSWSVFRRDGGLHPSPNAGQSEAAMAGALGIRLGGMNYYSGQPSAKPLLGAEGRAPNRADGRAALRIAATASVLVFSAAWFCLRWKERRS